MSLTAAQITARLSEAEIIAVLQDDFGLADILEIGDALLASPLLAWEIDIGLGAGLEAMADLSERAERLMLIGARGVQSRAALAEALAAGAHFVVSPTFQPDLLAEAHRCGRVYLPTVNGVAGVLTAAEQGCRLLKIEGISPGQLRDLRRRLNGITFLGGSDVSRQTLAAYVAAGVVAFSRDDIIIGPSPPLMAEIIIRARAWRTAWKQAQPIKQIYND